MNNQLFIPKQIKVGYQERTDTYSKRLAYIIYYDAKGKLRKETSWKGWVTAKLGTPDYENKPLEGFVLNKDVGGVRHSWSHNGRMEKVRVFDPRGFEFEITIPNLLFILQECSSVKGKGLDGEFVYCWDGPELILLPASCQEYKECSAFTAIQSNKVSSKEMVEGHVYITKKQENVVYMGKHNWTTSRYIKVVKKDGYGRDRSAYKSQISTKPMHIFYSEGDKNFYAEPGFTKIASKVSDAITDYASKMDKLQENPHISVPEKFEFKDKVFNIKPFAKTEYSGREVAKIFKQKGDEALVYSLYRHVEYDYTNTGGHYKDGGLSISLESIVTLSNGSIITENEAESWKGHNDKSRVTLEQLEKDGYKEFYIVMKNGKKIKFTDYHL